MSILIAFSPLGPDSLTQPVSGLRLPGAIKRIIPASLIIEGCGPTADRAAIELDVNLSENAIGHIGRLNPMYPRIANKEDRHPAAPTRHTLVEGWSKGGHHFSSLGSDQSGSSSSMATAMASTPKLAMLLYSGI